MKDIKNGHRKVEEWANKLDCKIIEVENQNEYNFLTLIQKRLRKAERKIK